MTDQAEQAFVKNLLNTLSTQPVTYGDDYQQPPENSLRKVPVLPIDLPPPHSRNDGPVSVALISVTFKSLKPPKSFTLSVHPTETISDIKSKLASQPNSPAADAQRLLLKGKALADTKLLREYNVKDGDTINLMVKPGFEWDPTKPSSADQVSMDNKNDGNASGSTLRPSIKTDAPIRKHHRIPSVVLTPSHSPTTEKPVDIPLTLDNISASSISDGELSTFHSTLALPAFWRRFRDFLSSEFSDKDEDVSRAFEDFFCASKGTLTASEIARIRDELGVIGMAGM